MSKNKIAGRSIRDYTPSCFTEEIKKYEQYLYDGGRTKKNVRGRVYIVARFLSFVEKNDCLDLSNLAASNIYDAFQSATCKTAFRWAVGAFLRWAFKYGITRTNLHLVMPSVKVHKPVPTVYTPEEVELLLSSIDRTTVAGKRNYAIILIAARLGLRASDIAGMTFACLHPQLSKIRILQKKTKKQVELPLLADVETALNDYIDNARPQSADDHIFLRLNGSSMLTPSSVGYIARRAFVLSGIDCGKRRMGSHAFRSSLATALLAEGNDYSVIQKILGHNDIQSVKSYTKADVEQLRMNALPVPLPSGKFAGLLNGGQGI